MRELKESLQRVCIDFYKDDYSEFMRLGITHKLESYDLLRVIIARMIEIFEPEIKMEPAKDKTMPSESTKTADNATYEISKYDYTYYPATLVK